MINDHVKPVSPNAVDRSIEMINTVFCCCERTKKIGTQHFCLITSTIRIVLYCGRLFCFSEKGQRFAYQKVKTFLVAFFSHSNCCVFICARDHNAIHMLILPSVSHTAMLLKLLNKMWININWLRTKSKFESTIKQSL